MTNHHYYGLPFGPIGFDGEVEFDLGKALADPKASAAIRAWAETEIAAGLKTKNDELLGKLNKYKVKITKDGKEEEVYLDPAEAARAVVFLRDNPDAAKVEERITAAVNEANVRAEAQVREFQSRIQAMTTETTAERGKRFNLMVDNALTNSLIDAGIKEAKLPLHSMFLRTHLKVESKEGVETIYVLDEKGNPRYGSSGPMTVAEFVVEYSQKKGIDEDFKANINSGSGANPNGGGRRGGAAIDPNLSPAARIAAFRRQQSGG